MIQKKIRPCLRKLFHVPSRRNLERHNEAKIEDNLSILQPYIVIEELFVCVDVVDER